METCGRYTLEIVETEAGLTALQPEWDQLHAESRPRNPFVGYDWTRICWEHQCQASQLFVLIARDAGRLVAVAPLRLDRELGFRVLRFIGDGRSDYLGFLHAADQPHAEAALIQELERLSGRWDLAVLRHLTDTYTELHRAQAPAALRGAEIEGTTAPYVAHDGPWEEVYATGPGWLKRMAKASRKFVKEGGIIERYSGAEAVEHVDEVTAVEAQSWKGRQGVARFKPGPGQELLREALTRLAPRGEMELWIARMDGQPVAFEINFLTPERICLYQGAYHEEYKKWSPGGVLDFLSIQRAWEAGAREYDFMSGDEPYKAERTNATRSLRYRSLYPANLRGAAAFALLIAPRWRLKGSAPAHAALQFWVQLKNNPSALIPAPVQARLRAR